MLIVSGLSNEINFSAFRNWLEYKRQGNAEDNTSWLERLQRNAINRVKQSSKQRCETINSTEKVGRPELEAKKKFVYLTGGGLENFGNSGHILTLTKFQVDEPFFHILTDQTKLAIVFSHFHKFPSRMKDEVRRVASFTSR